MNASSENSLKERPLEERVYTSENSKSNIFETLRTLVKEFPAAHALGYRFAARNITTKYRQSIFGLLWAFLPPLATASIWIILNKSNIIQMKDVGAPYPLFVITGTMLWAVFVNAVLTPMNIIQGNRSILIKINFAREALIVNAFYEILFTAFINLIIIIVVLVVFKVDISMRCLYFIPGVLLLIILGMSIGLLMLPFSLLYRDLQFVLPTVLQVAMYLTPVLYAAPPFSAASTFLQINPISPILTATRASLLNMDVHTSVIHLGIVAGISVLLFIIGVFLQKVTMKTLIERMGS